MLSLTPRLLPRSVLIACLALASGSLGKAAEPKVTAPREVLGFDIGDDYCMANYTQIATLWKKWSTESDRLKLVSIGETEEGRPQYMAIISAPENMQNLEHYRQISVKLARARMDDAEGHKLAREGKPVVWIDGGLHSSESVNSQQLLEVVYEMVSRNDEETTRILKNTIFLAVVANPDGVEVVANWLMRTDKKEDRSFIGLPRLYNKYIGHDNNRDSLTSNMKETANSGRVLFMDWIPQIMYNHHQSGPEGQVIFMPPYRDPFNYNFDPLLPVGIDRVGMAMHERLISKGMGGTALRSAAPYSSWWNGGYRNAVFWHNQIGLLTEVTGSPRPMVISFAPDRQLPTGDWPLPIAPQTIWHYRQAIDYDVEADKAVLDYAARNGELLLYNIYRMGRNSIERGSRDTWTITPKRIEAVYQAALAEDPSLKDELSPEARGDPTRRTRVLPTALYTKVLHDPAARDPRGYIISPDQPDFPTAVKFVNMLLKAGVEVSKSTAPFTVNGKSYPAGCYVVKTAQAFRPEVMDLFEIQDHPMDLAYPGGPPKPPYDIAGWTLVKQMGVVCDKIYDGFDGPFKDIGFDLQTPPAAPVTGSPSVAGWLVSHKENDSFILTNRLLKANCDVYWLKAEQTVDGHGLGTGTIWVPATAASRPIVEKAAKELGVAAYGQDQKPTGDAVKLKPIRIGLVDLYGGVMPSGWLRWLLEKFEFPFEVVYPQILDAGGLKNSFDVIIFPSDTYATGARGGPVTPDMVARLKASAATGMAGAGGGHYDPPAESIPEEYRSMLGGLTVNKTVPPLKIFVQQGGTVIALGSSATIGQSMGLPVTDHLAEKLPDGTERHLPTSKFYVPGSVLMAKFNNEDPLAYGMPSDGYIFFDSNPVFDLDPSARIQAHRVAWFGSKAPLYSGWAVGQQYLENGELATEASVGQGKLVLIGFEATFRGTPHSTFKLLFNGLYFGSATPAAIL
jgi:hypothetical protein